MSTWRMGLAGLVAMAGSAAALAQPPDVAFSGLIQVDGVSSEDFDGKKTADVLLSRVELKADASLQQLISAHVGFLYEEARTDLVLDEGTITLGPSGGNSFVFGKMYVPFGQFDSFMASDPLTRLMGEMGETVVMLAMDKPGGGYGSIYLFSGDSNEADSVAAGNNDLISGGFNFGRREGDRYDLGISYITNIADSNTLQKLGSGTPGVVASSVPGAGIHLKAGGGKTTLLAEQLMALESFSNGDLGGAVTRKEKPTVTNIELGFAKEDGSVVALGYQMTEQAQFIGLPETVASITLRRMILPGASLALEYAQADDYAVSDGGTGKSVNTITLQMAMAF